MTGPLIKAASRSFSRHPVLRQELMAKFPAARFNDAGVTFDEASFNDFIQGADGVVVGLEAVTETVLAANPGLQIVAKYGVGLDSVDQAACARHGVAVGWTGGVNRRGVAEMTLCYMIGLCRHILFSAQGLRDRQDWEKMGGTELSGRTVGIIGVGFIGKELIDLLKPFNCEILVNDIIDQTAYYRQHGLIEVSREEIFERADVVTLHTPLDDTTRHLVGAPDLAQMKPSAYLINVARGGIVDQAALKQALREGQIAGAALDVFETEPCDDVEFLRLPNLVCTPHTGGSAAESILATGRSAIYHLDQFFNDL